MTVKQAIEYLENYPVKGSRPGLERIRVLMEKTGNPHLGMKYVHVAGSNGKGSTCAFLDSVLRAAGYRTGLYTSPHLEHYLERIRVNGEMACGRNFARAAEEVRRAAESMDDVPTWFEVTTAVAFLYFRYCGCEIVVLEAGMGGEFDATNVIDCPEAAVLTNIGLEHTQILGRTIREIARTKAGIIKHGCEAVFYDGDPEAREIVEGICGERSVPLTVTDFSALEYLEEGLDGQTFKYRGREVSIRLLGKHQAKNAAAALDTIDALIRKGWAVGEGCIRKGFAKAEWPARFEILSKDPLFILDGGHNPQCALALKEALADLIPGKRPVFLTGILADKDYESVIEIIRPMAEKLICLTPVSDRALDAGRYAAFLQTKGLDAKYYDSIGEGIRAALTEGKDSFVVVFGSLYLAGAVRSSFRREYRAWLRKDRDAMRGMLPEQTVQDFSERIVRRIIGSHMLGDTQTVMLYRNLPGEVDLNLLAAELKRSGRHVVYPACVSERDMVAREPLDESCWTRGRYGIEEPGESGARQVDPSEIDLVLCPCTVFDEGCRRMGRGSGYYDRFLAKCGNAKVAVVAFELQRVLQVPAEPWDIPACRVFTEEHIYTPSFSEESTSVH